MTINSTILTVAAAVVTANIAIAVFLLAVLVEVTIDNRRRVYEIECDLRYWPDRDARSVASPRSE